MATEDREKVRVAACWNATLVLGANAAAVEANIIIMVEVEIVFIWGKFRKSLIERKTSWDLFSVIVLCLGRKSDLDRIRKPKSKGFVGDDDTSRW